MTVNALSTGLDRAQARCSSRSPASDGHVRLSPDRLLVVPSDSPQSGGFPDLSDEERQQLQAENGGGRFGLRNLGEPGEKFSRDNFVSTAQLSFPASEVAKIRRIDGVSAAAGGLTLNSIHIEGTVPEADRPGHGASALRRSRAPGAGPPENINASNLSVTGVDQTKQGARRDHARADHERALLSARRTPARRSSTRATRAARAWRRRQRLARRKEVHGRRDRRDAARRPVVGRVREARAATGALRSGVASTPSTCAPRAPTTWRPSRASIESDARRRVGHDCGGSGRSCRRHARDAKNLAGTLGTALMVVGLLAAFLIASLLTLSSVTKRIRELGTLKALGWSQRLVVRQVTGESLHPGPARRRARRHPRDRRCAR